MDHSGVSCECERNDALAAPHRIAQICSDRKSWKTDEAQWQRGWSEVPNWNAGRNDTPPRPDTTGKIVTRTDPLFDGPGEMRALCRAFDWSATPLGPVSEWPISLRTTVAMVLASRHPMFLWWGPELIQIFNDAYRPSFGERGRHITALGARGAQFWKEIWSTIGPQIAQVMAGGGATWQEDQLIPIVRNGTLEDVWWTYGYSPVTDDEGRITGTLVVCQETTRRVLSEYEHDWLLTVTARAERRTASVLERMADAYFTLDEQFRFASVNDAMQRNTRLTREELLGRNVWELFPGAVGNEFDRQLRRVARDRTEAHFSHSYTDDRLDLVVDVDLYPVEEGGVAVFWRDITARSRADALVRLRETELRTLADAIPTLAWTARPDGHVDWYNARWYDYTGTTPAEMEGWGWQAVHHPTTLPQVLERWRASLETGEPFEMTFPLRGKDGQFRSFLSRMVSARDEAGHVVRWFGTNTDVEADAQSRRDAESARERISHLHALTAALASSSTVSEIASAIVTHATVVLGAVGTVVARHVGRHL
jgi:PAS domain S-box-containing protein